jgi:hypothetical protein
VQARSWALCAAAFAQRVFACFLTLSRRSNAECMVYHKLVDNLGLFHELEARTRTAANAT